MFTLGICLPCFLAKVSFVKILSFILSFSLSMTVCFIEIFSLKNANQLIINAAKFNILIFSLQESKLAIHFIFYKNARFKFAQNLKTS